MNAYKLVFPAKACFKVVVRSVKIGEAIVFLVDPYYLVLPRGGTTNVASVALASPIFP